MSETASIIFAAGRGTRMAGYGGNKTLLPLIPGDSPFEGSRPLIREVLDNLPPGPKAIVVNHCADDVRGITAEAEVEYVYQPETNGTGGALLAARFFLESIETRDTIITMGDVPLIRSATYKKLLKMLETHDMAILSFEPGDRAKYGMLEMQGDRVSRIVEWKYWSDETVYPRERQERLKYCNAGVYAAKRTTLLEYVRKLENRPHEVIKERDGKEVIIKEYFLTDIAEMMNTDNLKVGMLSTAEDEVIGVDTPDSLRAVQKLFAITGVRGNLPV